MDNLWKAFSVGIPGFNSNKISMTNVEIGAVKQLADRRINSLYLED